ncbi:hypothetical protein SAMN05444164_3011 [Bradyrhizobium erythrophlei]|uniref:Uncharacterized protein n=1 Tax=Bradyrhizobium erythrophlei TaxID=1437360 RepID=A0A1H4W5N5_9BRAD|nr:hypothetical protein SAMN05444164_3011 [Bradyrhizobium erythrophlei]
MQGCIHVIASHPVGAKRRRMTGSAKQSIVTEHAERWIASSLSLLAMTERSVTCSKAQIYRGVEPGAGGTVSISLPVKMGAEVGWPFGEPPACSTVTA